MLGTLTSLISAEGLDAMTAVGQPTRNGLHMLRLTPFGSFETRTGWFTICTRTDTLAKGVMNAIGRPDLASKVDYRTRDARVANSDRLNAIIAGCA